MHAINPISQEAEVQPGLHELVQGQTPRLRRNPVSKTQNKQPNKIRKGFTEQGADPPKRTFCEDTSEETVDLMEDKKTGILSRWS